MSIVIHEVAHAWTADKLGDKTARYAGRLTLNPISHLDPVGSVIVPILLSFTAGVGFGWAKPVPYNPYNIRYKYGDSLVAFAGPLSNLIIAVLTVVIASLFGFQQHYITYLIVLLNVSLMIFNLIPVPPLDGSKIISPLLPYSIRERFLRPGIEQIFLMAIVIFVVWPLISPVVKTITDIIMKLSW